MKTSPDPNAPGLDQYSLDTLMRIQRDLAKNDKTQQTGSWEFHRMRAITKEINRRIR